MGYKKFDRLIVFGQGPGQTGFIGKRIKVWVESARRLFLTQIGLNFDDFKQLQNLSEDKIQALRAKFGELKRGSQIREETYQRMKTKPH